MGHWTGTSHRLFCFLFEASDFIFCLWKKEINWLSDFKFQTDFRRAVLGVFHLQSEFGINFSSCRQEAERPHNHGNQTQTSVYAVVVDDHIICPLMTQTWRSTAGGMPRW